MMGSSVVVDGVCATRCPVVCAWMCHTRKHNRWIIAALQSVCGDKSQIETEPQHVTKHVRHETMCVCKHDQDSVQTIMSSSTLLSYRAQSQLSWQTQLIIHCVCRRIVWRIQTEVDVPLGFVSPRLGKVCGFIRLAVNLGMVLVFVIVIAFVRVSVGLGTRIRQSSIGLQRLLCATSPTQQLHLRNDDLHKRF